jgi:hypothetical protein
VNAREQRIYRLEVKLNELPRSKLRGIEKSSCEFFRFLSPPNVFIGGPSGLTWIPAKSMRE